LSGLLAALQFLTLWPIKRGFSSLEIGRSTAYFPIIGFLLGLILMGLYYLLKLILPLDLVIVLLLAALVVMSGGLHLDGLADTLDGMAGHRTPERRLEIMRDSRIGGFGAMGLVLFLLIEYIALNSVQARWVPFTLLLAPVMSRWAMVNSIFAYPYARREGLGKAFKEAVNWQQFWIATVIALAVAAGLFRLAGLVVMAFTWLAFTLAAIYFRGQLKGLTGDTYGAINEIAFIASLLAIDALAYKGWLLP
jgi:adenosylcobinamide-GDP ribazoletransferase